MQVSEKSITQMGYRPQGSRPFLVFISCQLILRNFWAQNRAIPLLKLRWATPTGPGWNTEIMRRFKHGAAAGALHFRCPVKGTRPDSFYFQDSRRNCLSKSCIL
jgi:hypothetical protein